MCTHIYVLVSLSLRQDTYNCRKENCTIQNYYQYGGISIESGDEISINYILRLIIIDTIFECLLLPTCCHS